MGKRIDFETLVNNLIDTDKNILNFEQQIDQLKKEKTKLVKSRSAINKKVKVYIKEFLQQLFYEYNYHFTIEKVTIYSHHIVGIDGFDTNRKYGSRQIEFKQCNILNFFTLGAKIIDDSFFLRVVPKTFQEKYLSEL